MIAKIEVSTTAMITPNLDLVHRIRILNKSIILQLLFT